MSPRLELKTVSPQDGGYLGVLLWDGVPFAVCADAGVLRNGTYLCKRDFYNHGGYATFEVQVDGHDRVLFHKGNFVGDSKACVIVAESFAVLDGHPGIADSKHGFEEFMQLTSQVETFYMQVSGR